MHQIAQFGVFASATVRGEDKKEQFGGSASAGRPGGVGDGSNAGNGAVEEDSDEGSAADEDWKAADECVVAPDPALHPFLPRPQRPAAPVLLLEKKTRNRTDESITMPYTVGLIPRQEEDQRRDVSTHHA